MNGHDSMLTGAFATHLASMTAKFDRLNETTDALASSIPRTPAELRERMEAQRDALLDLIPDDTCEECGRPSRDCTRDALNRGIDRAVTAAAFCR